MTGAVVLDLLVRSSMFLGALLLAALALGRFGLGRSPSARHGLLLAALVVGAAAPLWLSLPARNKVARRGPERTWQLVPDPIVSKATPGRAASGEAPVAASRGVPVAFLLLGLWGAGAAIGFARVALGLARTRRLRRTATLGAGPWPQAGNATVLVSDAVEHAVVVGVFRPVILIGRTLATAPAEVLAHVLAHERAHVERRDPGWGLVQRLVTVVYWFHLVVHLAGRALSQAREEACDERAVRACPGPAYARTLLDLATGTRPVTPPGLGMMGGRSSLGRRIARLVEPARAGVSARRVRRMVTFCGFALLLLGAKLTATLAPGRAAAGARPARRPEVVSANVNAEVARIFGQAGPGVEGAFVLHDPARARTIAVNPALASTRVTPASTFKLVVATLALETGVAADERFTLPWDGQRHGYAAWNQDLSLASAMRTSANWYFQELLRRLDPDVLRSALRDLEYGNQDVGADPIRAWMDGTLRISPLEQVRVLERLLPGARGFSPRTARILASISELERRGEAVLHGKTGTAHTGGEGVLVWMVGHVSRGLDRWPYALLLRAPGNDSTLLRAQRLPITRALLERHGAWPAGTHSRASTPF